MATDMKIIFLLMFFMPMTSATCATTPVIRNHVIDTIPSYSPYYELSFDYIPYKKVSQWSSLIHVSNSDNKGSNSRYGDQNPAVYVHPQSSLIHIRTSINGDKNFLWASQELPWHKATNIKISQSVVQGKLLFRVFFNGVQKFSVENTQPMFFRNVTVYSGNSWMPPAGAIMRNYKMKNGLC